MEVILLQPPLLEKLALLQFQNRIQQPAVALGEPPLCNAGPHPGTTWNYKAGGIIHQLIEQPGHAGWLPRAPVLSGGLRRKTQLFLRYPLHMAASSKTPPHQSKGLRSSTPRPSASFPRGSLLCRHTSVKNHQT
ncbi:hypothetical protein TNCV_3816891 [Trichonephila clavipes]|nr:hypothetical protein TNCV_3816891 [Trichonephila clavipes]